MYEHVPIYHSIVLDCTPSYAFCGLTSHHRVRCSSALKQLAKHHSHVTNTPCKAPQKSRRGRYSFICPSIATNSEYRGSGRQNIARAIPESNLITGVGARRGHWFVIAIMLFLVLRHPTCASCVARMCCRMSNSIKHVWACPDQSSRRGHWFHIAIMLFLVLRHPTSHHVLHESVVGCPLLSTSKYEHVPINHRGVGIDFNWKHDVVSATSSNLRIMCCMDVL